MCGVLGEANPGPLDYRVSAYTNCATEPPDLGEGKTLLGQCAGPLNLAGPRKRALIAIHQGALMHAMFPPQLGMRVGGRIITT